MVATLVPGSSPQQETAVAVAVSPVKNKNGGDDIEKKKTIDNAGPAADKSAGPKAKPEPKPQVVIIYFGLYKYI